MISFRNLLFAAAASSVAAAPAATNYKANAEAAVKVLQGWYDHDTGIYDTTGWWNSANALTALGDLAALDSSVAPTATSVFANTFTAAPNHSPQAAKFLRSDFLPVSHYTVKSETADVNSNSFLDGYYDDDGWWALAWIQAYDVTKVQDYLTQAIDIFNAMSQANTTPCSNGAAGIWWDQGHTYVNAIANELFLSVAAHLANRASNKQQYLNIAKAQWTWFQKSGMINSQNLVNDGLTSSCQNNGQTVWSYNQGVILGGLVELSTATGDSSYLTTATNIATAAIKALSDSNNVLHDPCEPNCGADGSQFKGVFMRNLQRLQKAAPNSAFLNSIRANAGSIWSKDQSNGQLDVVWSGPFSSSDASKQSSALDAIVAAVAFQ